MRGTSDTPSVHSLSRMGTGPGERGGRGGSLTFRGHPMAAKGKSAEENQVSRTSASAVEREESQGGERHTRRRQTHADLHTQAHIHRSSVTRRRTHRRADAHMQTHRLTHTCTQTYTHANIHTCRYTHADLHTHKQTETRTQTHTRRRTHTQTYTHVDVHTRRHTHADMPADVHTRRHIYADTQGVTRKYTHADAHTRAATHACTHTGTRWCAGLHKCMCTHIGVHERTRPSLPCVRVMSLSSTPSVFAAIRLASTSDLATTQSEPTASCNTATIVRLSPPHSPTPSPTRHRTGSG